MSRAAGGSAVYHFRMDGARRAGGSGLSGLLLTTACLLAVTKILAFDYVEQRGKEVRTCDAINPADAQSGLLFNPDGYRSYYVRSKCFQEAAVRFRDQNLCAQVRQRRSSLSSSWGYSAARCRQLVTEGIASDRRALDAMRRDYVAGGIRLRDFRVERNGNGRDIDIIPAFVGTYAHSYVLTFEILLEGTAGTALLHSSGYYVDEKSNLRIYIPSSDVRRRFSAFDLNRVYTVHATMTFDVGFGGQSGYWSDTFIEGVFPTQGRSSVLIRRVTFQAQSTALANPLRGEVK